MTVSINRLHLLVFVRENLGRVCSFSLIESASVSRFQDTLSGTGEQ